MIYVGEVRKWLYYVKIDDRLVGYVYSVNLELCLSLYLQTDEKDTKRYREKCVVHAQKSTGQLHVNKTKRINWIYIFAGIDPWDVRLSGLKTPIRVHFFSAGDFDP